MEVLNHFEKLQYFRYFNKDFTYLDHHYNIN